jgi:hypothetical protein
MSAPWTSCCAPFVRSVVGKTLSVIVACSALVLATRAGAGPFLDWSRPATAHVGELVEVRAGAGVRMYALLPLYLVAAKSAPPLHACRLRNGSAATCPASSLGPPREASYYRVGTLNVRHANTVLVTFRVPRLAPGRYVYVIYCGPCWRGPRGSLIAFSYAGAATLTVVR